jgi:hypothetical protein
MTGIGFLERPDLDGRIVIEDMCPAADDAAKVLMKVPGSIQAAYHDLVELQHVPEAIGRALVHETISFALSTA